MLWPFTVSVPVMLQLPLTLKAPVTDAPRLCQRQRVVRRAPKVHANIMGKQQVARRDVYFLNAR